MAGEPSQRGRRGANREGPARALTGMGKAFGAVVAAGLLGLVALGWHQATGADRLRGRARAGGLSSAHLLVREMG